MKLDKVQIARRQLGAALALFIKDGDPVSVHTLACAGSEIAEHLTGKTGAEPFSTHMLATFPDLDIKNLRRIQNQYWNAFKHAKTRGGLERQDQELLDRFTDKVNDHTLFVGWHDYMMATGTLPVEAQIFQLWYFALYPEKLNSDVDTSPHQAVFPNLRGMKRLKQKQALRAAIALFRRDPELTGDARTDARPLILSAEEH